ncbi:hypothetical protein B0H14DRAFT_3460682 [Mycena olivaceomarginata]|nr:hypothetical protein B0H14DRAFT_3460682 [Mycena olivaceomarginata]
MHTIKFYRTTGAPPLPLLAVAAPQLVLHSRAMPPGPPIRSDQRYLLSELLEHANLVAIHRESQDPLYRGEELGFFKSGKEPTDGDISDRDIEDSIFASDTDTESALGSDSEMEHGCGGESPDGDVSDNGPEEEPETVFCIGHGCRISTDQSSFHPRYIAGRNAGQSCDTPGDLSSPTPDVTENTTLPSAWPGSKSEEAAARRPSSPRRSLCLRPFRPESARKLVRDEGHTIHALVNSRPRPLVDHAG